MQDSRRSSQRERAAGCGQAGAAAAAAAAAATTEATSKQVDGAQALAGSPALRKWVWPRPTGSGQHGPLQQPCRRFVPHARARARARAREESEASAAADAPVPRARPAVLLCTYHGHRKSVRSARVGRTSSAASACTHGTQRLCRAAAHPALPFADRPCSRKTSVPYHRRSSNLSFPRRALPLLLPTPPHPHPSIHPSIPPLKQSARRTRPG